MNKERNSSIHESEKSGNTTPSSDYLMSPLDLRLRSMSMSYCITPSAYSNNVSKNNSPIPKELTPRGSVCDISINDQNHIHFTNNPKTRFRLDSRRTSDLELSESEKHPNLNFLDLDETKDENIVTKHKSESESEPEGEHKLSISLYDIFSDDNELQSTKSQVFLIEGTIKERVVREKSSFSRKRCLITDHSTYLPLLTLRHCRTGRIKQGIQLIKKFGIWTKDMNQPYIALKVMEKSSVEQAYSWDEDNVYKELKVMRELCIPSPHPNILFLHEVIETSQYIIAVLELVDGDLQQFLPVFKTESMIRELFQQICLGYQYIIKRGYYHGDISPENILIKIVPNYKNTGKTKHIPKLSDFGRSIEISKDGKTIIDIDHVAGKPYYLAPEAYVCSYDAGPADIWALGITLYVLLYSYPPFEIANESDAVFVHFCDEGYKVIDHNDKTISEDAKELLRSMIVFNPLERTTIESILKSKWITSI